MEAIRASNFILFGWKVIEKKASFSLIYSIKECRVNDYTDKFSVFLVSLIHSCSGKTYVGLKTFIKKKIDLPKRINYCSRPRLQSSGKKRHLPFSAHFIDQLSAQHFIVFIKIEVRKAVCHLNESIFLLLYKFSIAHSLSPEYLI